MGRGTGQTNLGRKRNDMVTDKLFSSSGKMEQMERELCMYQDLNDDFEWFCNVLDNNTHLHIMLTPRIRTTKMKYSVEISQLL